MTEKISTNLERDIYEVGALFGRYEQADAALKRVIALAKLPSALAMFPHRNWSA